MKIRFMFFGGKSQINIKDLEIENFYSRTSMEFIGYEATSACNIFIFIIIIIIIIILLVINSFFIYLFFILKNHFIIIILFNF